MGQAKKEDFCVYCREVRPYSVVKKKIRERIRDKDYSFVITTYVWASRIPECRITFNKRCPAFFLKTQGSSQILITLTFLNPLSLSMSACSLLITPFLQ